MRRRILSTFLLITTTIFFITGCGAKSNDTAVSPDVPCEAADSKTDSGIMSFKSEAASDGSETTSIPEVTAREEGATISSEMPMSELAASDSGDWTDSSEPGTFTAAENQQSRQAGLLTAGEWNDNNNWAFFTNLIANQQLVVPSFGMNPINRIKVDVVSNEGSPVKNAKVELISSSQDVIWDAITDYNGTAYVFFNLLSDTQVPQTLTINKNGATATSDLVISEGIDGQNPNSQLNNPIYQDVTITLDDTPTTKALDLMFVFDTTGSMSDELSYLQTEFMDIAQKIENQDTRYSMNFYRDEGDDYVVKSNEFAYDTNLVLSQLEKEYASGGGDYPEAVDQALNDAIFNHNWNAESVKLLFIILDAPPHGENLQVSESLQESIKEAAQQGIRIIPVASSGVDKDTETFLRTASILTGGTYTFLTDDSGIGESHLEPTIGDYEVENLNDCIIRIITTYCQ